MEILRDEKNKHDAWLEAYYNNINTEENKNE